MNAREVLALVAPLKARIMGLVTLAEVRLSRESTALREYQLQQSGKTTPDDFQHLEPYGFTSAPAAGAEAVVLNLGGDQSRPIVIAVGDRRYRVQVAEGEVAIYHREGHKIVMREDRITVEAPLVEVHTAGEVLTISNGVLTGADVDPYTGQTYASLGMGSSVLRAEG
jgi:phage baseplate assembly protein V